ncbi:MAG: alpha/beta hydrolase-fold protein [Bacteroidales bacterium]|jgi:predicted alpha/beta superfamily hydrolase|nr:alpha/beta hydrolase-fold protein [Bacteroidales bacterium]
MKKTGLISCIIFSFFILEIKSQQVNPVELPGTESFTCYSSYVEDSFLIQVALPKSYAESAKNYPVLYVLDSDMSFGMARDIVNWLNLRHEIPEIIIVGASYPGNWWQKRSRDYTFSKDDSEIWGKWPLAGGADNYLHFIQQELFKKILSSYRIDTTRRIIAGLSLGGLLANYILFTKSQLFDGYIISGPALQWNYQEIFRIEQDFSKGTACLRAKVFTSVGDLDQEDICIPWDEFNQQILSRNYNGLEYRVKRFEDETHISVWPVSLSHGLRYYFSKSPTNQNNYE